MKEPRHSATLVTSGGGSIAPTTEERRQLQSSLVKSSDKSISYDCSIFSKGLAGGLDGTYPAAGEIQLPSLMVKKEEKSSSTAPAVSSDGLVGGLERKGLVTGGISTSPGLPHRDIIPSGLIGADSAFAAVSHESTRVLEVKEEKVISILKLKSKLSQLEELKPEMQIPFTFLVKSTGIDKKSVEAKAMLIMGSSSNPKEYRINVMSIGGTKCLSTKICITVCCEEEDQPFENVEEATKKYLQVGHIDTTEVRAKYKYVGLNLMYAAYCVADALGVKGLYAFPDIGKSAQLFYMKVGFNILAPEEHKDKKSYAMMCKWVYQKFMEKYLEGKISRNIGGWHQLLYFDDTERLNKYLINPVLLCNGAYPGIQLPLLFGKKDPALKLADLSDIIGKKLTSQDFSPTSTL